jgi:hypothetical protein
MASTHILIGTATTHAQQTRSAIDQLQNVCDAFAELKATYDQAGAGGDWTTLGGLLGLSPTNAETVYNLVTATNTALGVFDVTTLLARCG